jgi:hypothetical protein
MQNALPRVIEQVPDSGCKAWTWVSTGIQGRDPACWLNSAVLWRKVHATSTGMISGTRQHNSQ